MDENDRPYINDNLPYSLAFIFGRAFIFLGLLVYIILRISGLLPSLSLVENFIVAILLGIIGLVLGFIVGLVIVKIGYVGTVLVSFLLIFLLFTFAADLVKSPLDDLQQSTEYSGEMQELINFLMIDKTDEQSYYPDPHRGVDFFVCSGFTRDLAKNANEYGIEMGGVSLRDTMSVGEGTRYYHAMNYCIIDNKFIIIEPQSDKLFTLDGMKFYKNGVYKYITIFPNAQMMTSFGKHKETIDIYIYGEFNETELIEKFPPQP